MQIRTQTGQAKLATPPALAEETIHPKVISRKFSIFRFQTQGGFMKKVRKAEIDNRAEQLNPTSIKFLKSRIDNLTPSDVSLIQRIEVKTRGKQIKGGLGAEAQRLLATQETGC